MMRRWKSRYYQAQLDVSLLEPGVKDFNRLNDSCMILVAPFDIFGRGLYRYTFEGVCRECPDLRLEDGAMRVFINTNGTNKEAFSQEFLDFMDYLTNSTNEVATRADSERIKKIHNQVEQIRLSEKTGVKYMTRWEELEYARDDGREEGLTVGREEGLIAGREEGRRKFISQIVKKLTKGKSEDMIAEELEETLENVHKICLAAQEYAPEYDVDKIYHKLYEQENSVKTHGY